LHGHFNKENIF